MKLSGQGPSRRGSRPKGSVVLADMTSVATMGEKVGFEVTDSLCICGKARRVFVGRQVRPFLGCPDFSTCDGPSVDLFQNFSVLPTGAVWEGGEAVFYRDELGEPT